MGFKKVFSFAGWSPWRYNTAVIAQNGTVSTAIEIGGAKHIGLVMPSAWDTATLGVQVSHDGTTYQTLYDDAGIAVTIQAAASRSIGINVAALGLAPFQFMKLVASAAQTTAARSIVVVAKG